MKTARILALCLCAALLWGCQSQTVPPATTTVPTTAPTEPTVPPTTEPPAPDWLNADRISPSYDDFFTQNLPYNTSAAQWLVADGNTMSRYYLLNQTNGLYVSQNNFRGGTRIPNTEALTGLPIVGVDGRWAYLLGEDGILRADLTNGEFSLFIPHSGIFQAELCGYDVLYYAAVSENGTIGIYRMYIPTMTVDVLCEDIVLNPHKGNFRISFPDTTLGTVTWSCFHPDMLTRLAAELADPNSPYREGKDSQGAPDYLWEIPNYLEDPYAFLDNGLMVLCDWIQDDTGIPCWYKCTYNCATGELTEDTGVVDGCWYGTGFAHDHYEPEVTSLPTPTLSMGTWQNIPDAILPDAITAEELYAEGMYDYFDAGLSEPVIQGLPLQSQYPCQLRGSTLIPVTDFPVTMAAQSVRFLYCITEDNTVVQLSHDGSICNVLYTAEGKIHQISYAYGHLYLQDGNTLVEIDIPNLRYRVLLEDENLCEVQAYEEAGKVYFAIGRGLYYQQYLLQTESGALEKAYII